MFNQHSLWNSVIIRESSLVLFNKSQWPWLLTFVHQNLIINVQVKLLNLKIFLSRSQEWGRQPEIKTPQLRTQVGLELTSWWRRRPRSSSYDRRWRWGTPGGLADTCRSWSYGRPGICRRVEKNHRAISTAGSVCSDTFVTVCAWRV